MIALRRAWPAIPIAIAITLLALRACAHVAPLDRLARDAAGADVTYRGSIFVARGGPVIFGFVADAPARLAVGGRELRGSGLVKERIVVPAGPLAIELAAPPGADPVLVWSPVGRRGDPEYVSASSLSPEPPARATFDNPGTDRVDGVIALLLLATGVGAALYAARARLRRVPRAVWLGVAGVLALGLLARLVGRDGFGQTWDEDTNWAAGRNYVTNVLGLDFSPRAWLWNYEHPPVMKLLDGIGAQLADGYGPARTLSALWCALGCALLVPIGARLFGLRAGVLAGAVAALLPPLVAHGQIVGHESPTVLWWSLAIVLALGVFDGVDDDDVRAARRVVIPRLVAVGAVIGVAVASRFVNGLVGVLALAIVTIQAPAARRWRWAGWGAAVMPVVAVLVFVAVWPRLWPWHHPLDALAQSLAKLDTQHAAEPFLGISTNRPGPHYFLVYLAATLPIGVALAVIAGIVRGARERSRAALIVGLWWLVPLGVALSPVRQDGVRYVMPCLTAFAMLAGAGIDHLATYAGTRARAVFAALAIALVGYLAIVDVRVAPYYLDYFGEAVGGAGGVQRRAWCETAWWGEGVDRAVAYVNAHAAPSAPVYRDCIQPAHLAWFRADLWTPMVHDPAKAAWIVKYGTDPCRVPADARAVFEVEVDGAVLATVFAR